MSRLFRPVLLVLASASLFSAETTVDIGIWKVAVTIPKPAQAGKALDVDLVLTPAAQVPKAVRLWVGTANARGSVKVKAEPEAAGAYCVGVEVADPIPAEAQVWIAIEAADGTTIKASVALPAPAGK
jgi:hypothetical protein